jgi:hypothetical protein
MQQETSQTQTAHAGPVLEVFAAFFKLGLTSFGGPIAHLGYFRHELVERRNWVGESQYAQLLALCQFLPGPASRDDFVRKPAQPDAQALGVAGVVSECCKSNACTENKAGIATEGGGTGSFLLRRRRLMTVRER